jgi:3-vinyl bacteriochlorophyllide hydratase
MGTLQSASRPVPTLYTPAQRRRRDRTLWTPVQGVLAILQFVACGVSLMLLLRYLVTGDGLVAAQWSFIVKFAFLLTIMVTGSLWERRVFGQWLFAPAFFWEDVVSMLVIALHALALAAMLNPGLAGLMAAFDLPPWTDNAVVALVLAAYAAYAVNAAQFVLKLRAARKQQAGCL